MSHAWAAIFASLLLAACGSTPSADGYALHTGGETPPPVPGRRPTAAESRAIAPLAATAERVRGLRFVREVPVRVQTASEITGFVSDSMEAEELERARLFYVALGMLPADLDVEAMLLAVMGEQIVGYYDPDGDRMVIRDDIVRTLETRGADPESASVLVHEYVHALQDQNLELSAAMETPRSIDAENAFSSVVEGDATLAMIGYMSDLAHVPLGTLTRDPSRMRALLDSGLASARGDELASAPPIVRVPLLSHYFDGMLLCAQLHASAGWPGVDGLHRRLPTTSEQVLHPEAYLAGEPGEEIELPRFASVVAAGFVMLDEDTLGELEISVFLARGHGDRALEAAAGWGGDRVRVYRRGEESLAIWFLSWDTEGDAIEAEAAIARSARTHERTVRSGRALQFTALRPSEASGLAPELAAEIDAAFAAWAATLPTRLPEETRLPVDTPLSAPRGSSGSAALRR